MHCLRDFEEDSTFLRHVTHSKGCLLAHDEEFINSLRKDCKRRSRLKSYHRQANGPNKDEYKEERKKRRLENPKKYYVPNKIKHTVTGIRFGEVFQSVFEKQVTSAKTKLEVLSESQKILSELAAEKAMDYVFEEHVFKEMKLLDYFVRTGVHKATAIKLDMDVDEETRYLKFVFRQMEVEFKCEWDREHINFKNGWVWDKNNELRANLFPFALNKAFLEIYKEEAFKKLYQLSEDNALDIIFLQLTPDGYFPAEGSWQNLEFKMIEAFGTIRKEEMTKIVSETDLLVRMDSLMEKILKKKFSSMNLEY